jgi:hypothetical protein
MCRLGVKPLARIGFSSGLISHNGYLEGRERFLVLYLL